MRRPSEVTEHLNEPQARKSGDGWWTTAQNSVWHHFDGCGQQVPQGRPVWTADQVAAVFIAASTEQVGDVVHVEWDHSRTPFGKRQCDRCWGARRKVSP